MTLPVQTPKNTFVGDGAEDTFAFTFRILDNAHLFVEVDGASQTEITDYTIENLTELGGDVVFVAAPANNADILIFRDTTEDQQTDYNPFDAFPAETHERALDKLTMIDQEQTESIAGISGRIPEGTVENSTVRWDVATKVWLEFLAYLFPDADGNANEVLTTDGDGQLIFAPQTFVAAGITDQILSSVAGVLSIVYQNGQSIFVAMDEDITSTVVTGLPASKLAQLEFEIDQDDPVRTWVWPANTTWIGGAEPDLSVVDGKYLVRLRTRNAGTSWMGTFGEDFS